MKLNLKLRYLRIRENFTISPMICSVIWFHIIMAGILLSPWGEAASMTTLAGVLITVFDSPQFLALVLFASSILAFIGLSVSHSTPWYKLLLYFMWQESIVIMSAAGSISFILESRFYDGYSRDMSFILLDQAPLLCMSLFYLIAVFRIIMKYEKI